VAFYFGSAGGIGALTSTTGGAQDRLFRKGAQQLSLNLAKELGDKILLEHVVSKIEQNEEGVVVRNSSVSTVLDGAGIQMLMPSRRS